MLSPKVVERDRDSIDRALRRAKGAKEYQGKANPGSGKMSLIVLCLKFSRRLGLKTISEVAERAK